MKESDKSEEDSTEVSSKMQQDNKASNLENQPA